MAVMGFDEDSREMFLKGTYPGITRRQVIDHMGFSVNVSRTGEVPPPTAGELNILRDVCDPQRLILG